jgi:DNA-binding response OmpR family regulator
MVYEQDSPLEGAQNQLILLVEDEPAFEEFLVQAIVLETPYRVVAAHDGFEALHVVSAIKPRLLILDYLLPGMNGLELFDALQRMEAVTGTPTIMMSATLPTQELAKRKITGLSKPFNLNEFLEIIDTLLAEKQAHE